MTVRNICSASFSSRRPPSSDSEVDAAWAFGGRALSEPPSGESREKLSAQAATLLQDKRCLELLVDSGSEATVLAGSELHSKGFRTERSNVWMYHFGGGDDGRRRGGSPQPRGW